MILDTMSAIWPLPGLRRARATASLLLALSVASTSGCARKMRVQGDAMAPTIPAGSAVIVNTIVGTIKRFDVVITERDGFRFVRRVVVLPGERFDIVDGHAASTARN
jgi:phage repressor protein C with HTH and peptisase S24 domain